MDKRKAHILLSWLLLLFFAAGQVIVYAHQHHLKYNASIVQKKHSDQHQTVQEKCSFCDQMHHAPMGLVQPISFGQIIASVKIIFYAPQHRYTGNTLVHADGLSPPVLV